MSSGGSDKIQFRGAKEKEAAQAVDALRLGGVNVSELAREGLGEMLRRTLSDEERVEIHRRYERGEISEEAARVLLGDALDEIERERDAFAEAMELDTDGVFRD